MDSIQNKIVLVTGASGFIGQYCLRHLKTRNFKIHAVYFSGSNDSPRTYLQEGIDWHQCDLNDNLKTTDLLTKIRPNFLLHLAWYAEPIKFWNSDQNLKWVALSLNLIQSFCEIGGKRLVVAGTCAEYSPNVSECDESTSPCKGGTLYGISKHSLYQIVSQYLRERSVELCWGRIFNLFGSFEKAGRFVPNLINSLLKEAPFLCKDPLAVRDFLYVDDVANALVGLLDSSVVGPVNISGGNTMTIGQLALLIADYIGRRDLLSVNLVSNPDVVASKMVARPGLLQSQLNWKPAISLNEAIKNTIEFWNKALS